MARRYTTITLKREVSEKLERVKRELGAKSLGEVIEVLIDYWRERETQEFTRELSKMRREGVFKEIREAIKELRGLKWARYT